MAKVRLSSGMTLMAEVHWYEAAGIGIREFKIKRFLQQTQMSKTAKRFVFCLDNAGYEASLEARKVYLALPDPDSEKLDLLRVVDESGDDYLFPKQRFIAVDLPMSAKRAFMHSA